MTLGKFLISCHHFRFLSPERLRYETGASNLMSGNHVFTEKIVLFSLMPRPQFEGKRNGKLLRDIVEPLRAIGHNVLESSTRKDGNTERHCRRRGMVKKAGPRLCDPTSWLFPAVAPRLRILKFELATRGSAVSQATARLREKAPPSEKTLP